MVDVDDDSDGQKVGCLPRYFRMTEILNYWSIVGKQMGKRGQLEYVGATESKERSPSRVGDVALVSAQKLVEPSERGEKRLKPYAASEEGNRGHGYAYAYVGVLAVDGEGRDWT